MSSAAGDRELKRRHSCNKMQTMMGVEAAEAANIVSSLMHHDEATRPRVPSGVAMEEAGVAMARDVHGAPKSAKHTEHYDVPAAKMWDIIKDWSAPYMTAENSPFRIVAINGTGPGATRAVAMLDDANSSWSEAVSEFDDAAMTWAYIITSPLPAPLDICETNNFVCTMSVEADSNSTCRASISASYFVVPGTDPESLPPLELMYKHWTDTAFSLAAATP